MPVFTRNPGIRKAQRLKDSQAASARYRDAYQQNQINQNHHYGLNLPVVPWQVKWKNSLYICLHKERFVLGMGLQIAVLVNVTHDEGVLFRMPQQLTLSLGEPENRPVERKKRTRKNSQLISPL